MAVYSAVNDPKQIKKMEPKRMAAKLSADELPAMLRIPKKKKVVSDNG